MSQEDSDIRPLHIDVKKNESLTIKWSDGAVSTYLVNDLRRLSPSADARDLREKMEKNPLTVLPSPKKKLKPDADSRSTLSIENVELAGNYAVRIIFSDGHRTGIYSWKYLRQIDQGQ